MNQKNTGGPAFPEIGNVGHNSDWQNESGMTLRDYAAIHADISRASFTLEQMADVLGEDIPSPLTNHSALVFSSRFLAKVRYIVADAMIEARDK